MSKFKKLHLLLLVSAAINVGNVYASAEADDEENGGRTASSASASAPSTLSSSFYSNEDFRIFLERVKLKLIDSNLTPLIPEDTLEIDRLEALMKSMAIANPHGVPCMTASSASSTPSSSFSSEESHEAFQNNLQNLLEITRLRHLIPVDTLKVEQMDTLKVEQRLFLELIKIVNPHGVPCMLNDNDIETYVTSAIKRFIDLLKHEESKNSDLRFDHLNIALNQVLERGPKTTEPSEATADPKKYPYKTSTGMLVSEGDYLRYSNYICKTILYTETVPAFHSFFTNPYRSNLVLRIILENLNSFGLTRRLRKED